MLRLGLALALVAGVRAHDESVAAPKINHVVVLMMENRAFDHILGHLHRIMPGVEGLRGNETNPEDPADPNSKRLPINERASDKAPDDPCHSWDCTTMQIFGTQKPTPTSIPHMNGFVKTQAERHAVLNNPISMFNESTTPILHTLAQEFSVFDHWFCSVPGPTNPNREYLMSGSSHGAIENSIPTGGFQQKTHMEQLHQNGKDWRIYYSDDPWSALFFNYTRAPANKERVLPIEKLWGDIKAGSLPAYTYVQPRLAASAHGPANWQHPTASVREGERLIKETYEALRASPLWSSLVFIITYDEHGGFYDHVPPPMKDVPSPDGIKAPNGFNFDRLGVRIPTVVVSPFIPKGTIVKTPTNGPHPSSQYDTTSIISTTNKLLGVNAAPLTARVAWAGTFDHIVSLSSPRADCPLKLPNLPASLNLEGMGDQPITDHQEDSVNILCELNDLGAGCGAHLKTQAEASDWVIREYAQWRRNH